MTNAPSSYGEPIERLDEIERGCEGVTRGPWSTTVSEKSIHGAIDDDGWTEIAQTPASRSPLTGARHAQWRRDREHIARLDPQTVLALIAHIRSQATAIATLTAERDALEKERDTLWNTIEKDCFVGSSREKSMNARLTAAEEERDRLALAVPDLSHVISWLRNGCDPSKAADELEIYQGRATLSRHRKGGVDGRE